MKPSNLALFLAFGGFSCAHIGPNLHPSIGDVLKLPDGNRVKLISPANQTEINRLNSSLKEFKMGIPFELLPGDEVYLYSPYKSPISQTSTKYYCQIRNGEIISTRYDIFAEIAPDSDISFENTVPILNYIKAFNDKDLLTIIKVLDDRVLWIVTGSDDLTPILKNNILDMIRFLWRNDSTVKLKLYKLESSEKNTILYYILKENKLIRINPDYAIKTSMYLVGSKGTATASRIFYIKDEKIVGIR